MEKKVFICCPGDIVTGGPELLHQLASTLQNLGVDSYMLYTPFEKKFTTPIQYQKYNTKVIDFEKEKVKGNIIIIPETLTHLINKFQDSEVFIWWLSIDNYFDGLLPTNFKNKRKHLTRVFKKKRASLYSLSKKGNITQSEHARLFLEKYKIKSFMISDYLNNTHTEEKQRTRKENIIVYNPKKGYKITSKLIEKYHELKFIPIENMTPEEVSTLMKRSKIYIDFGTHPGKDRLPREAAIAGCCIITGRQGSAGNNTDVPIPKKYKLSDDPDDKDLLFINLVHDIFENFENNYDSFSQYREIISNEENVFKQQVKEFTKKYVKREN
ncbi:hypothetical protein [Pectobacterium polaris]|uniref:hypothetical protein n=1 Tax=Pectobacterium polaris TaxID=2042057 RepID=UPI0013FD457A|nr:hypothetical protein [Pectobacterium polaris]